MSDWESAPSAINDNTRRFLDFLAKAEGADYNVITGGGRFDDFSRHPGVVGMVTKQGPSTAAGRYQITKTTYNDVAPKLGITDFSPASQDRIAIELIKRGNALGDVESGNYAAAINKLGGTWASLPSSPYAGHPRRSVEWVNKAMTSLFPSAQASQGNPTQGISMAAKANDGWESAPSKQASPAANNNEWEDAPVRTPAPATQGVTPKVTPAQATQPTPQAPSPTPPKPADQPKSAMRRIDDFVRGAADAITFGYADEIAAKLDQLTGLNTANAGKPSGTASYEANLAAQRERDKQGGGERLAGQLSTVLLPTAGAIRAADTATRTGRAAVGATTGAAQGALYGSGSAEGDLADRAEAAAVGGGIGLAAGGVLGTLLPATVRQTGNAIVKKAGSEGAGKMDAEIIRDINKVAGGANQRDVAVGATQLNALENKYIGDVTTALKQVGKKALQQTGLSSDDIATAVRDRRIIGDAELSQLRSTKGGTALADAIEKAQRARSLTAPVPAATNPLARVGRAALDLAPIPQPLRYVGQRMLGSRQTREDVASRLVSDKQAQAAEDVLQRLGPSAATQSLQGVQQMAQRAQAQAQARAQAQAQARAAQQAQNQATRIGVLQQTRRPLSGGFQELLPGGRANTNLTSGQAIDALRLLKRQGGPVGDAADQILKSRDVTNRDAFFGLQNAVRGLQERGVVQGGPQAGGALSSGIRNPVSYAEAVRTAGEAANIARTAAPNKALAQFATKVAGTKSPADKAKILQERLDKTTDPAEISYLTQFVEPLTRFGAK